jgi:hypothetical protein
MPTSLVRQCAEASVRGDTFPTVWHDLLKGHSLVADIPRQRFDGARSFLEIPLVTGHCVVYDPETREFSLQIGPLRGLPPKRPGACS